MEKKGSGSMSGSADTQVNRAQVQADMKFKEEKLKEQLLKISEISLWLDTYDDIFSDFDPRPFSQRSLSVDFLDELKRASRDKVSGQIELKFLIPDKQRIVETELQIRKRLREHFKKHHSQLIEDKKKISKNGFLIASFGFFNMFLERLFGQLFSQLCSNPQDGL
jgi:hypothetical protein